MTTRLGEGIVGLRVKNYYFRVIHYLAQHWQCQVALSKVWPTVLTAGIIMKITLTYQTTESHPSGFLYQSYTNSFSYRITGICDLLLFSHIPIPFHLLPSYLQSYFSVTFCLVLQGILGAIGSVYSLFNLSSFFILELKRVWLMASLYFTDGYNVKLLAFLKTEILMQINNVWFVNMNAIKLCNNVPWLLNGPTGLLTMSFYMWEFDGL